MRGTYRPRYHQIAEQLRQQMKAGTLRPGDRLPSFEEMRAQGISQNTMEKVHALLEREHLVERRPRQGTFVAAPRERMRRQRKGIIGLGSVGFSFIGSSAYWSLIMQGMQDAARANEMQILLLDPDSSRGWEKADGVLLAHWDAGRPGWLPESAPCVSLMVPVDGMASAFTDDQAGMRMATERLLQLGHRRIGFIHGKRSPVILSRIEGYQRALQAAGIEFDESLLHQFQGPYDYGARFSDRGREAMNIWLKDGWKESGCTAILAHNDETALGIMEALQDNGISVPGQVSVAGFDGTEICEMARPRLASVSIPLRRIGSAAVELLLQEIETGEITAEHRAFPPSIKDGDSIAAYSYQARPCLVPGELS